MQESLALSTMVSMAAGQAHASMADSKISEEEEWNSGINIPRDSRRSPPWRVDCEPQEDKLPYARTADRSVVIAEDNIDEAVRDDEVREKSRTRLFLVILVLGLVTATIVDLACHNNVRSWLEDCFQWIEDNPKAGVVVFAFIFFVATILFVPGIILTVGAGVAFGRALGFGMGILLGSVAVLAGAFAACMVAFYLGRYIMHDQAQQCASRYRIVGAINTAIETNGIKIMFLLRLSPLVPFSGFNFIAGLTKVTTRDYAVGCLGVVPGTIAFVFIGASTAGSMHESDRMDDESVDRTACLIRLIVLIVGCCAAVLAMVAMTIYSRRALKEALRISEAAKKAELASNTDLEGSRAEGLRSDRNEESPLSLVHGSNA